MKLQGRVMDRYLHERYFQKDNPDLGRVHSIFQSVINVETAGGEIFALSHSRDAYMPYMVQVKETDDFLLVEKLQGEKVIYKDGRMSIGTDAEIRLYDTEIIDRSFKDIKRTDNLSESIETARGILLEKGKRGGCLGYIGQYLGMDLMEKELAKRIASLETTLDFGRLIGFGRGLTPSGDDFSVGFLCAVRSIRTLNTETESTLEKMAKDLKNSVRRVGENTTDVSRQMLRQSLDDQFIGPLMDLCEGIIRGESPAACKDSMIKLLNIGSTSGTDMATGVIYALERA